VTNLEPTDAERWLRLRDFEATRPAPEERAALGLHAHNTSHLPVAARVRALRVHLGLDRTQACCAIGEGVG
jgi:isopropylmalate/homocitrate/citramalate synthase